MKTYKFQAQINGDVIFSDGPKPIYDEYNKLIGAFNLLFGSTVACFVAGSEYPASILVSTGQRFYFTPQDGEDGKIASAVISEMPSSPRSSAAYVATESFEAI